MTILFGDLGFISRHVTFRGLGILYKEYSLLCILLNSVPCGADGLLGDAHDAAHVLVVHAHFVEEEEEGVMGGLGLVFLLEAAIGGEVDGLVVVDKAFVVVV